MGIGRAIAVVDFALLAFICAVLGNPIPLLPTAAWAGTLDPNPDPGRGLRGASAARAAAAIRQLS